MWGRVILQSILPFQPQSQTSGNWISFPPFGLSGIEREGMRNDPRRRRRKKMVRKRDDGLWRIRRRRASCNDFSSSYSSVLTKGRDPGKLFIVLLCMTILRYFLLLLYTEIFLNIFWIVEFWNRDGFWNNRPWRAPSFPRLVIVSVDWHSLSLSTVPSLVPRSTLWAYWQTDNMD